MAEDAKVSDRYAAFISYRHLPADRRWALRIMQKLEGFRTPRPLVAKGYPLRLRNLFRDEDEIPASSDLSAEIEAALERSDFLIVVCSPETPGSIWVRREIASFHEMGKGDRIIALLIAGEPVESFPPELRYRMIEGADGALEWTDYEVEPIAADVRLRQDERPARTERRALLRLASALLGCRYDDLARRDEARRKTRFRLTLAACAVVLALIGTASGLWLTQTRQANVRLTRTLAAQLAERSKAALATSDDDYALRLALYAAQLDRGATGPSFVRANLAAVLASLKWTRSFHGPDEYGSVAFSPDGTRIVATAGRTVQIWDIATARLLLTLTSFTNPPRTAVFNQDGTQVLTSSGNDPPTVWSVATGKAVLRLAQKEIAFWAAFSADGSKIVSTSLDKTAMVWDARTGELLTTLTGHTGFLNSAEFNRNGTQIVTASDDDTARIWDVATGRQRVVLRGHTYHVIQAAFSADGDEIVTAGDKTARLWDARSGRQLKAFAHDELVNSASLSPDGQRLVTTAYPDRFARLWDAGTGVEIERLTGDSDAVLSAAFDPDGKTIATASTDKSIRFWPAKSGQVVKTIVETKQYSPLETAIFHNDNRYVVAYNDSDLQIFDAKAGNIFRSVNLLPALHPMIAAGNSHVAYVVDDVMKNFPKGEQTAFVLDPSDRSRTPSFKSFKILTRPSMLALSPDSGKLFIVYDRADASGLILDPGTGRTVVTLACAEDAHYIRRAFFSGDARKMLLVWEPPLRKGERFVTARVCDTESGATLHDFDKNDGWVENGAFTADGKRLLVFGTKTRIVDADTWESQFVFPQTGRAINSAAFGPDGNTVALGSDDARIQVWDSETSVLLATLIGHTRTVSSVAFSANGRELVSASDDKTLRIWDVSFATMSTQALMQEACARRLTGATRMSSEEMRSAGLPDGQQGLDLCAETRAP